VFAGRSNSSARGAELLHDAAVEHEDAVGQGHRLDLIVGDVHDRGAEVRCRRLSSTRICPRKAASRFESGSSNKNTLGRRTMARPMATRWR
jgi:hypothetical protein